MQLRGALKSQTLLPMPPGTNKIFDVVNTYRSSQGEEVDLGVKASIENSVIKWFNICTDILQQNSRVAFANGEHPTPMREIEFWNARLKNLECIYDQLRDPRVKQMICYLEMTESSYMSCFQMTFKNIVAGVLEARDICLYLKPLVSHFERFEAEDFLNMDRYIKPLVHVLALVWSHSKYYCTSSKIVTLLQEIGNMLIEAATRQLDPSSIFQGDTDEIYQKINTCIEILVLFQTSFEQVRSNLLTYFDEDTEPVPWTFHPRNVFQRLMDFINRLHIVKHILGVALEFGKLEKVEIGGIKGRSLSQKSLDVHEEFNNIYMNFGNIQYDILCPEDIGINRDYEDFMDKCSDFDRRLAAIFSQAFDDCHNLESIFKLINVVGNLIDRPIINAEVTIKYPTIVNMLSDEADTVKILYDNGLHKGPPIDKYFPPVAGRMMWLYKLKERISRPLHDFKLLEHNILNEEETIFTIQKIEEMLGLIEKDEDRTMSTWMASVPEQIAASINKVQIVRTNDLIDVNFDKEMVAVLREVRYLKILNLEEIAPEAEEIFVRFEELFKSTQLLNRIIEWFNHLKTQTLPEEYRLIEEEMQGIDNMIEELVSNLTWESDSKTIHFISIQISFPYISDTNTIEEIYDKMKLLYDRVLRAQQYVRTMVANIESWSRDPLYERKDGKKEMILGIDDRTECVNKRYELVAASAEEIKTVLYMNYNLFFNIPIPEDAITGEEEEVRNFSI